MTTVTPIHPEKTDDRAGISDLLHRTQPDATIRQCLTPTGSGQVLGRLTSSTYYVRNDTLVEALSREMDRDDRIFAVGVVDGTGQPLGVITRPMLFDMLGRPFGRDLYRNRTVDTVANVAERFRINGSIFSVSQALEGRLYQRSDEYFILVNDEEKFAGIFSTRDLLIYLSDLTRKDIDLAMKLQSCIVPAEFHETTHHCELAGVSKMAKGVGGDYYACRRIDGSTWLLAVCDVSGKGISAALLTTIIGGMMSVYDFTQGMTQFITSLNRYIVDSFAMERYLTGVFVLYNELTGACTLYDLGHSYIYLLRNGKLVRLKSSAETLPIGITHDLHPRGISFGLKDRDTLVLVTDGIEEQRDSTGERFGITPLGVMLRDMAGNSLLTMGRHLMGQIREFRGSQAQDDDMTLVMLRRENSADNG